MIVKCLIENTSLDANFESEHGLSLYIESQKHKILFDLGASDIFIRNAAKLSVDLSDVDIVIISHGHNDHGGGLKKFLEINSKAKIYITKTAFTNHYSIRKDGSLKYNGLDQNLITNERLVFTDKYLKIDDELTLFSQVKVDRKIASINQYLLMEEDGKLIRDDFSHEQNLLVKQNDDYVLFGGCAHMGIVNIINESSKILNKFPVYVISGFHLFSRSRATNESDTSILELAEILLKSKAKYYTCHCTGQYAYKILKNKMGTNLEYLSGKRIIEI